MRVAKLYPFMSRGGLSSLSEADNITEDGWWIVTGTDSSVPLSDYGTVISYRNGMVQEFHPTNNHSMMFIRVRLSSGWRPWQRLDNFGCNTKEELASMVAGVINPFTSGGRLYGAKNSNIDELTGSGIYAFYYNDLSGTTPTDMGSIGFVIVYGYNVNRLVQMMVCYNCKTYIRGIVDNDAWSDWRRIDNFGANTLSDLANALKPLLGLS